jgi:hypothetical protein
VAPLPGAQQHRRDDQQPSQRVAGPQPQARAGRVR